MGVNNKSPFFQPSSNHRMVVVQQRTPGGSTRTRQIQPKEATPEAKSSMVGTASNLVNAIVGCGIVGLPFALRKAGFVAGVVLVVFVALATEKSLRLLVFTAKHVHVPSYETLAEACFGRIGFRFVCISMFVSAYGAMISYLMLVKDSFGALYLERFGSNDSGEDETLIRRTILLLVSLAIMLPLSCKRDMADLSLTSRLNVVIDTTLVAMVAYNAPMKAAATHVAAHPELDTGIWIHYDTIFVGLGVLSFAFVCQHSAFIIAGSLQNPTSKRWSTVTGGALSVCATLALICGITGFLGYRDGTKGNILENLDADSITANIARAMLGTTMMFVFPLECFVARHVCVVLLFSGRAAHEGDDSQILARRDRRVILTTALYILAVVPASLAEDLGSVLALTGAIGGSCLSYLGPGLIYLGIHGERFLHLAKRHFRSSQIANDTALESTPLVRCETRIQEVESGGIDDDEVYAEGIGHQIAWILLGMPLWCAIAKLGKARVQVHVHDMALKSPHPIRIGNVEYKRIVVMTEEHGVEPQFPPLSRENSLPKVLQNRNDTTTTSTASQTKLSAQQSINQKIGKDILEKQKKSALEADPQDDPPECIDFAIAIGYVLLGFVALFAGIGSIFIESKA